MGADFFSWQRFQDMPVVGVIRNLPPDAAAEIFPLYAAAGLTTLEITMNTPGAEDMIRDGLAQYGGRLNIGAGTVCNTKELDSALKAGAQFIVTPLVDQEVIRACVSAHIPVFPGAFTATEVYSAWALGAGIVKLFPATTLGPGYIRDLKGPFPKIRLMPTGGVSPENAVSFLEAGAIGLGMGGQLFDPALIREKNWSGLQTRFEMLVNSIRTFYDEKGRPAPFDQEKSPR